IRYALVREAKTVQALPNESHNFLDGLRLPEKIKKLIDLPSVKDQPLTEFARDRSKVLVAVVRDMRAGFYGFNADKSSEARLLWMRERLEAALSIAAGVSLHTELSRGVATPGTGLDLAVKLSNGGNENV